MSFDDVKNKKLIFYFDQNVISNIAKSCENDKYNLEDYKKLKILIKRGIREEKIILTISLDHYDEFSIYNDLVRREKIVEEMENLKTLCFKSDFNIVKEQVDRYYNFFRSNKKIDGFQVNWEDCFDDDPDNELGKIKVEFFSKWSSYKKEGLSERNAVDNIKSDWDKIRKINLKNKTSFKDCCLAEVNTWKDIIKTNIFYSPFHPYYHPDDLELFINSEYFYKTPYIDIESKMLSQVFIHLGKNRFIDEGDYKDIKRASTVLPYVDVFVTDNTMSNVIKNLHLDDFYKVNVFSAKKNELKSLLNNIENYLENSLSIYPKRVAIFINWRIENITILREIKDNLLEQNKSGLVEIIFYTENSVYQNYEKNLGEYDFSKVFISFSGHDILDGSFNFIVDDLDKLDNHCRSEKYIIVDELRKIPDNFIETLLNYCDNDKDRILNWKIYKK